jgi:hypothetical protein
MSYPNGNTSAFTSAASKINEHFETSTPTEKTPEAAASLSLSDKEQTLFDDLLSNKLTDVNIQSLIDSGFLTESMIEKFLQKVVGNNEKFIVQTTVEGGSSAGHLATNREQKQLTLNPHLPPIEVDAIPEPLDRHLNLPQESFTNYTGVVPNNTIYARYY